MNKKNKLIQSNCITQSAYKMGLQEKRVIYLAILMANSRGRSFVKTLDYSQYFNVSPIIAKKSLRGMESTIIDLKVILELENGNTKGFVWVQSAEYHKEDGSLEILFSDALTAEITNLKNKFTEYDIIEVGRIKNVYIQRLYECFSMFQDTHVFVTSPGWLFEKFSLPKSYASYPVMKQKFLTPAIKEIMTKTRFTRVSMEEVYKGRKVHCLKFYFFDGVPHEKTAVL